MIERPVTRPSKKWRSAARCSFLAETECFLPETLKAWAVVKSQIH